MLIYMHPEETRDFTHQLHTIVRACSVPKAIRDQPSSSTPTHVTLGSGSAAAAALLEPLGMRQPS
jgi:hypothetical protein